MRIYLIGGFIPVPASVAEFFGVGTEAPATAPAAGTAPVPAAGGTPDPNAPITIGTEAAKALAQANLVIQLDPKLDPDVAQWIAAYRAENAMHTAVRIGVRAKLAPDGKETPEDQETQKIAPVPGLNGYWSATVTDPSKPHIVTLYHLEPGAATGFKVAEGEYVPASMPKGAQTGKPTILFPRKVLLWGRIFRDGQPFFYHYANKTAHKVTETLGRQLHLAWRPHSDGKTKLPMPTVTCTSANPDVVAQVYGSIYKFYEGFELKKDAEVKLKVGGHFVDWTEANPFVSTEIKAETAFTNHELKLDADQTDPLQHDLFLQLYGMTEKKPNFRTSDEAVVRELQHDMKRLGYYAVAIDGDWGGQLSQGLRTFRRDNGWSAQPEVNRDVARKIKQNVEYGGQVGADLKVGIWHVNYLGEVKLRKAYGTEIKVWPDKKDDKLQRLCLDELDFYPDGADTAEGAWTELIRSHVDKIYEKRGKDFAHRYFRKMLEMEASTSLFMGQPTKKSSREAAGLHLYPARYATLGLDLPGGETIVSRGFGVTQVTDIKRGENPPRFLALGRDYHTEIAKDAKYKADIPSWEHWVDRADPTRHVLNSVEQSLTAGIVHYIKKSELKVADGNLCRYPATDAKFHQCETCVKTWPKTTRAYVSTTHATLKEDAASGATEMVMDNVRFFVRVAPKGITHVKDNMPGASWVNATIFETFTYACADKTTGKLTGIPAAGWDAIKSAAAVDAEICLVPGGRTTKLKTAAAAGAISVEVADATGFPSQTYTLDLNWTEKAPFSEVKAGEGGAGTVTLKAGLTQKFPAGTPVTFGAGAAKVTTSLAAEAAKDAKSVKLAKVAGLPATGELIIGYELSFPVTEVDTAEKRVKGIAAAAIPAVLPATATKAVLKGKEGKRSLSTTLAKEAAAGATEVTLTQVDAFPCFEVIIGSRTTQIYYAEADAATGKLKLGIALPQAYRAGTKVMVYTWKDTGLDTNVPNPPVPKAADGCSWPWATMIYNGGSKNAVAYMDKVLTKLAGIGSWEEKSPAASKYAPLVKKE